MRSRIYMLVFTLFLGFTAQGQVDSVSQRVYVNKEKVDSIKKDEAYWYVDKTLKQPEAKEEPQVELKERKPIFSEGFLSGLGSIMQLLFYLIIAVAIGGILYLLYKNADFFEEQTSSDKVNIPVEVHSEETLQKLNYQHLIQKAKSKGEFSQAIRWYYLSLLKELSLKERIQFSKYRTNNEYKSQLAAIMGKEHAFTLLFKELIKAYEYVWFGKTPLTESQFLIIEDRYKEALASI